MSSFREAVEKWNERFKHEGYQSSYSPTLPCAQCDQKGAILSTIHGETRATCGNEQCRHTWLVTW